MNTSLRVALISASLLAGLYLLACALLAFNARGMLYHPLPRDAVVPHWILLRDDVPIIISSNNQHSAHVVLYFGGNAEDVSQTLPLLQQAFPDSAVHAMHYRGYGGSGGTATESRLIGDAFALYDQATAGARSVTLIGRSLGSGIAVQLAAARPARQLVLVTPYDSVGDLAAGMFPIFPVRLLLRDHYDSYRHAGKIRVPTTLLIAGRDEVIPNASSVRLLHHFPPGVANALTFIESDHNSIARDPRFITALRGKQEP